MKLIDIVNYLDEHKNDNVEKISDPVLKGFYIKGYEDCSKRIVESFLINELEGDIVENDKQKN